MAEKIIGGFSVVAYATQPEGRVPPRAFLETRPTAAVRPPQAEARPEQEAAPGEQNRVFEIFVRRRFRSTVEAMSAARNALDRVQSVDADGVPDPLPE
ncbi:MULTISPECIES: hypothetical protein [unclassified Achromobacter]|uniref:hypothetical protein n=1 Tax=unclassified Achromobacter TaxID=2626865 RepID=UPI00069EB769|nr:MULTISPECIES: hypothetical protein [unclassified Achromobacter]KOF54002.1 hypothetical protein AD428_09825 [Achromobacter sp. DMS1]KOF54006.1 hypothetical protein AD428_09855 [Achromobacter sp. DMS1]